MVLQYSILGGYSASGTMYRTVDMTEAFHPTSKHKQVDRIPTDKETHLLVESIFGEQKVLDKL